MLAPILFGIFFSMLLRHVKDCSEGVYIHTRADGKLFNIALPHAKTKVNSVLICEMLFSDDAALTSHTEDGLQQLVNRFSDTCKHFGLITNLKKTKILAQGSVHPPTISIDGQALEAVEQLTCLGSTISLTIDAEINIRIAEAAAVMSKLNHRVWNNSYLTVETKLRVYQACMLSTFLYSSESWSAYARHEKKRNSFHLRCLCCILHITWQEKVTNSEVLERASTNSMFALLIERRLRWFGHVKRMEAGRIPKDLLYGELAEGSRLVGHPCLRFRDACKRDLKRLSISTTTWEDITEDCVAWGLAVRQGVLPAEVAWNNALVQTSASRKRR